MIRSGLGIHAGANAYYPMGETEEAENEYFDRLEACGFQYVKLLNVGKASALRCVQKAVALGMTPIVRCYRPRPHASTLDADPDQKATLHLLVEAGCKLYELQNEPNVKWEWPDDTIPPDAHEVVARNFAIDADFILSIGGVPLLTAMSPGGEPGWDDIEFLRHMVWWLKDNWGLSRLALCAIACHPAALNHALDYPFDAVNQTGVAVTDAEWDSHEWAGSRGWVNEQRRLGMNVGQKLLDPGASNGWNKWKAVHELVLQETGLALDVYATEGGIWPGELQDPRYPKVSKQDVTGGYLRIAREMMTGQYPDWFKCTGFWLMANKGAGNPAMEFEYSTWWNVFEGEQPWATAYRDMPKHARLPYVGEVTPPVVLPPVGGILSDRQIAAVLAQAGFTGDGWTIGVAVVLAESGGRTDAVGDVDLHNPGDKSLGMWQFYIPAHQYMTEACAFDALCSSRAAFSLSKGGTDFGAWSTYNNGAYLTGGRWDRALAVTQEAHLPTPEELRRFAWRECIGVPEDAALMREGRRLGLVPICGEGRDMIGCGPFVGQLFTNADGALVLLYCRDQQPYAPVYRQDL